MDEKTPELTVDEKREIAKLIARESKNDNARLAAMRYLDGLEDGTRSADEGFAGLYDVSNPGRTRVKKAS